MNERWVSNHTEETVRDCTSVLSTQGLLWESDIEFSVIIYDSDEGDYRNPVATGSFSSNVIKCLAVRPSYEGTGLAQRIVTLLIEELSQNDADNIFVFTKPKNIPAFQLLGFHEIVTVDSAVTLMEQDPRGIERFCEELNVHRVEGMSAGALVMNCNPFTLGHRYVIEQAARECSHLFVIVVAEDRSEFSTEERLSLITSGVSDITGVAVLSGGDYVISRATFPTYFLKDEHLVRTSYARIDAMIFARYLAPALGVRTRFVGDEPFCPVTRDYNAQLKDVLGEEGITLKVIDRLEHEGIAISASRVRSLFAQDRLEEIATLVPESTYRFLSSPASGVAKQRILKKIQTKEQSV